jgi:hypothetical protein
MRGAGRLEPRELVIEIGKVAPLVQKPKPAIVWR